MLVAQHHVVLIAPFWYWNDLQARPHGRLCAGFNRTFLVLKPFRWRLPGRDAPVLIAPFWYWNGAALRRCLPGWPVLIAPFWYWNLVGFRIFAHLFGSFNRTFLVLKQKMVRSNKIDTPASFNRTFLVLKLATIATSWARLEGFNRTFLVLKRFGERKKYLSIKCFNRTFLVLKLKFEACG